MFQAEVEFEHEVEEIMERGVAAETLPAGDFAGNIGAGRPGSGASWGREIIGRGNPL